MGQSIKRLSCRSRTYPPGNQGNPKLGHAEDNEPVEEGQAGDDGDDDQPEPDENVDPTKIERCVVETNHCCCVMFSTCLTL